MAAAEKKRGKGGTPGRPKKQGNQFWDIGKVGRKTGITLEDKGIRDEHGLEPVSHIFSSPASPQRTFNSSEANMQETSTMLTLPSPGSGPDVNKTLNSRKTPRLPPPRTSTPRHTNIGSPRRSTGRPQSERVSMGMQANDSVSKTRTMPPPNRVLDFGEGGVRKSIESPSPFKPKHSLRRSMAAQHDNPFANGSPSRTVKPSSTIIEEDEVNGDDEEAPLPADDGPMMMDDDDYYYDAQPQQEDDQGDEEVVEEQAPKRKPGRPRKSGDSLNNSQMQNTPPVANMTSGRKRTRSSLDGPSASDSNVSHSQISESGRASKRGRPSREKVIVHHDEGDVAMDPSDVAHGDEFEADVEEVPVETTEAPAKGKGKGKGKKGKGKAPKERDANRAMGTKVRINDSPSKLRYNRESRENSRGLSVGPVSNVHLRASTPFEDAGERTSRFGRALIQPLKYWANEMRIYKHGETAGIVRADEVSPPKRKKPPKKKGKKKLQDIDEESDTESIQPDEWEEEVGVIAGDVANWNPETQEADPEDLVREDLGFAQSSITTRDVKNAEFKYAKIMTLPFFGSGVVELPPEGWKGTKNSSKMQMCFFVYEGKVLVEITAPDGSHSNQFAISKGGAWSVPRGNKYAITNESRTRTARLFFAQGCELEAMQMEEEE